jgi:hypothetical protein
MSLAEKIPVRQIAKAIADARLKRLFPHWSDEQRAQGVEEQWSQHCGEAEAAYRIAAQHVAGKEGKNADAVTG